MDDIDKYVLEQAKIEVESTWRDTIRPWLLSSGVVSIYVATWLFLNAVPAFGEVFAGFGADLPTLTIFVLKYHIQIVSPLAVFQICQAGLLTFLYFRTNDERSRRLFYRHYALHVVLGLFILGTLLFALYAPIWMMGQIS